jgi:hypothetical protein
MPELPAAITLVAYAKLHKVSRTAAYKWRARGLIAYTDTGKVDVAASNALLAAYRGRKRSGAPAEPVVGRPPVSASAGEAGKGAADDPSSWSTAEAIRRREIANALLRQIEADQAAGRVIPKADFIDTEKALLRGVRQFVLGLPGAAAFEIPTLSPHDRAVLERLARDGLQDAVAGKGFDLGGEGLA